MTYWPEEVSKEVLKPNRTEQIRQVATNLFAQLAKERGRLDPNQLGAYFELCLRGLNLNASPNYFLSIEIDPENASLGLLNLQLNNDTTIELGFIVGEDRSIFSMVENIEALCDRNLLS